MAWLNDPLHESYRNSWNFGGSCGTRMSPAYCDPSLGAKFAHTVALLGPCITVLTPQCVARQLLHVLRTCESVIER